MHIACFSSFYWLKYLNTLSIFIFKYAQIVHLDFDSFRMEKRDENEFNAIAIPYPYIYYVFIDILCDAIVPRAIETCEFNLKIDSRCRQWPKEKEKEKAIVDVHV